MHEWIDRAIVLGMFLFGLAQTAAAWWTAKERREAERDYRIDGRPSIVTRLGVVEQNSDKITDLDRRCDGIEKRIDATATFIRSEYVRRADLDERESMATERRMELTERVLALERALMRHGRE